MNRNALLPRIVFLLFAFLLSISTTVFARPEENRPFQQSTLPQITFLGQGPQTFTVEPPLKFLVKTYQSGQFLFVADDGPNYTADRNERVWTIDVVPTESIRLFDEFRSYGNVEAGCVVNYVQIEDNVDSRRNTFYINDDPIQVVEQGMVTYGTFTVPEAGELTFFAEDSIGMVIELCQNVQTAVPSETPPAVTTMTMTATPTQTATSELIILTPTATVGTPTATAGTPQSPTEETPLPSQTPTTAATNTSTAPAIILTQEPTETPLTVTNTTVPTAQTPSPTAQTVQITASPTTQVSQNTPTRTAQVVLITATPLATSNALPVTGGEPGPREIAMISMTLIGLFLLVGAAWWFLLRAYAQRR